MGFIELLNDSPCIYRTMDVCETLLKLDQKLQKQTKRLSDAAFKAVNMLSSPPQQPYNKIDTALLS